MQGMSAMVNVNGQAMGMAAKMQESSVRGLVGVVESHERVQKNWGKLGRAMMSKVGATTNTTTNITGSQNREENHSSTTNEKHKTNNVTTNLTNRMFGS